jgi:hypothetical protein
MSYLERRVRRLEGKQGWDRELLVIKMCPFRNEFTPEEKALLEADDNRLIREEEEKGPQGMGTHWLLKLRWTRERLNELKHPAHDPAP